MQSKRILKPGDKLKAKHTIYYVMGQIASDKICRNEVVTIEKLNPHQEGAVLLEEHADRYGPWYLEDFCDPTYKHLRKGQLVVFDGRRGKIVDKEKDSEDDEMYMVEIEFFDGDYPAKSWEVEDDARMGVTESEKQNKAKIDKLVQVIKSAKNPTSEFYKTINHLLR